MADTDSEGGPSTASTAEQQLRNEIEALRILDPTNNPSLEAQLDSMTEVEQRRLVEKLTLQNEADIQTFSMFLKLPTVAVLMLNLVFAYNYVVNGLGPPGRFGGPMVPFTSYSVYAEHPIVATEISVITLQFTLHTLSSGRWNRIVQGATALLLAAGIGHAFACAKSGTVELLWWLLPALNLSIASYAQLNMRRSRDDIEKLARRAFHEKNN
ncbi:hypothetical protein IWW55_002108 [Coemansia sp. RSA 2706]|nr:hypothetical protein IWW55_002108 [Coemansia sp. RSA 2706]KAJ2318765.1 hypothetical protein IWW52_002361 [Coemansia sp. RSA 2704]KAJ2727390.1 hypothetical protein H4R23_003909 [Coemansia sp. Cherry 401B]